MKGSIADVRGHCSGCMRWFSIPSDTLHAMLHALCPFCFATADQIEQRCGEVTLAVDVATPPVSAAVAPAALGA